MVYVNPFTPRVKPWVIQSFHWKAVEQFFTVVLFVFQFHPLCKFGKFINFGLDTVRSRGLILFRLSEILRRRNKESWGWGGVISESKAKALKAKVSLKFIEGRGEGYDLNCYYCVKKTLQFFLETFFRWMDKPVCVECGTKTELKGHVPPSADEQKWWVGVVEGYRCPNCGNDERFPRYNHPAKLLGKNEQLETTLNLLCW